MGTSACTSCGKPVQMNMRRCPTCGAWQRPWSTGGKPSKWAKYTVGAAGRPDDFGTKIGNQGEVQSSVWVRYGKNGEYVRQSTPTGQPAPSGGGGHGPSERKRRKS